MTVSERAKLKRIDDRRHDLYAALCIIKTWMSVPDCKDGLWFNVGKLITERIIEEQRKAEKEAEREAKEGGAK